MAGHRVAPVQARWEMATPARPVGCSQTTRQDDIYEAADSYGIVRVGEQATNRYGSPVDHVAGDFSGSRSDDRG